jgi:hypothetical protein
MAAGVAELTQSAGALGIILVTQRATGSPAIAGVAAALRSAQGSPARFRAARSTARSGSILALTGALHACALAALVAAGQADLAAWMLTVLAASPALSEPPDGRLAPVAHALCAAQAAWGSEKWLLVRTQPATARRTGVPPEAQQGNRNRCRYASRKREPDPRARRRPVVVLSESGSC